MPLYEYRCEGCGHGFTLLQSASVLPSETICPQCGMSKNRRLFSTFATKGEGGKNLSAPPSGGCGAGGCGCH